MEVFGRVSMVARVVLLLVTGTFLSACSTSASESDGSMQALRIANPYDVSTPFNTCGMSNLPDAVREAGGNTEIEVFAGGVLGSESEALEQVVTGELDGTVAGPAFLGKWYEPAAVMEAPYVFDSVDEVNEAMETPAAEEIWEGFLDETGVRVLDTWWLGSRHLMSTEPVRSPEDLASVRMRVPNNDVHMAGASAMGASPMPVDLGETYIGLQQGLISAVEGPLNTSNSSGFQEVVDYITLTGHVRTPVPVTVNEQAWEQVPQGDREIIVEELIRLGDRAQECVEKEDREILDEWVESGQITVVEDADIDAFRKAVRSSVPQQFSWADEYERLSE